MPLWRRTIASPRSCESRAAHPSWRRCCWASRSSCWPTMPPSPSGGTSTDPATWPRASPSSSCSPVARLLAVLAVDRRRTGVRSWGVARAEAFVRDPVIGGMPGSGSAAASAAASASAAAVAARVEPADLARERRLPVLPPFEPLLPGGALRRGATVAVGAAPGVAGATSLALALAAGPSQAGAWVAVVGLSSLGLVAADALGVALERLVMVADPGRDRTGWASVVGALVDGFDLVLVSTAPTLRLRPADARRLVARVRERGGILLAVGGDLPGERSPLRLTVTAAHWEGLGAGWGHLQGRRVTVETTGRGDATRPRYADLWLPDAHGHATPAEPPAEPLATPIPLHPRPRRHRRHA